MGLIRKLKNNIIYGGYKPVYSPLQRRLDEENKEKYPTILDARLAEDEFWRKEREKIHQINQEKGPVRQEELEQMAEEEVKKADAIKAVRSAECVWL